MRIPCLLPSALALITAGTALAQEEHLLAGPADSQEKVSSPILSALHSLRQEAVLPCDTWVALPDATLAGVTILAKNSDRTVFDCQPLFLHPRQKWSAGSKIDLGRVSVPQVAETYATMGSSPYWCWGYEEGINEFGVAIGNEGIFTRARKADVVAASRGEGPPLGPTGMDLLRMTLERSRTAKEAVTTLGALLEAHGQFGSGMPMMGFVEGAYDNSYLIADPSEAYVVETCGRNWVARRHRSGTTSISNVPSIGTEWDLASQGLISDAVEHGWWPADATSSFHFADSSSDPSPASLASAVRARTRAACSAGLLKHKNGSIDSRWMMRVARDRSTTPSLDLDVTASSCVAVLPAGPAATPVFWWCAGTPSNGCFVPYFIQAGEIPAILSKAGTVGRAITPPSRVAKDAFAADSYWWQARQICDLVQADYGPRNAVVRKALDPLEIEFEQGLGAVVELAANLRSQGQESKAQRVLADYTQACVDRVLAEFKQLGPHLRKMEIVIPPALQPFLGVYSTDLGGQSLDFEILAQDGRLAVRLPDDRVFDLKEPDAEGKRHFVLTDQAAVSFERQGSGPAQGMVFHQAGTKIPLKRR